MQTPAQVAKKAHVTPQTIRNYAETYAELLSPTLRPPGAPRLYSDEDAEILCLVATLRQSGIPPDEIVERVRATYSPSIIDVTPQKVSNEVQEASKPEQYALLPAPALHPIVMARIEAIERRLDTQDRTTFLYGMLWGAIGALVAGAFVLWVLWLSANGVSYADLRAWLAVV